MKAFPLLEWSDHYSKPQLTTCPPHSGPADVSKLCLSWPFYPAHSSRGSESQTRSSPPILFPPSSPLINHRPSVSFMAEQERNWNPSLLGWCLIIYYITLQRHYVWGITCCAGLDVTKTQTDGSSHSRNRHSGATTTAGKRHLLQRTLFQLSCGMLVPYN